MNWITSKGASISQGKNVSAWLGIRVYELKRQENGEILSHLRKIPTEKLINIPAIRIYDGHAFFIKEIAKLAKITLCVNWEARFISRHAKTCSRKNNY